MVTLNLSRVFERGADLYHAFLFMEVEKMKLKYELLANAVSEAIREKIKMYAFFDGLSELDIDVNEIADSTAIKVLLEIQNVIQNDEISDFDAIEKIVKIFERYNISAGLRHDF